MPTCKYCGENKKLVKSHIIPEAFFRPLRTQAGTSPLLITNLPNQYPKKSPIGVYDQGILCQECEDKFAEVDDYGARVLIHGVPSLEKIEDGNKLLAYWIKSVDVYKLKRFFLSVLWRASVSTQDFYHGVKLGPYDSQILQILNQCTLLGKNQFSFFLSRFDDEYYGSTLLDSRLEKWDGVNYYRIYFGGYVAHIKVDKRQTPPSFAPFVQDGTADLIVLARELKTSAEFEVMKKIVRAQN